MEDENNKKISEKQETGLVFSYKHEKSRNEIMLKHVAWPEKISATNFLMASQVVFLAVGCVKQRMLANFSHIYDELIKIVQPTA